MKKTVLFITLVLAGAFSAFAQVNTQDATAAAAAALNAAEDVPEKVQKPKYWNTIVITNIAFGQTYLSQWAAGGYNNVSLAGNIDANANYAKNKVLWTNRLQMDYGFLYSADKPIIQKNKDRIYFESKWAHETPVRSLLYSANLDFKTQFGNNYNYGTPATTTDAEGNVIEPTSKDWLAARKLKSGFFAPAYLNLGVGAMWTPAPWISLNIAPISCGGVFVTIPELRKTYGMDLRDPTMDPADDNNFKAFRLEFGAQLKLDMSWVINDVFSFATQFTAFYNYLTPKMEPRLTWDNKIFWKLRRFFALTLTTNLIYDPRVIVKDSNKDGIADSKGVQFREYFELGFTYSINVKH